MTEPENKKAGLDRLKQAMVDDILNASDEEILAQFTEDFGSPEANAARMRARFEGAVLLVNKDRLRAARAGAAERGLFEPVPAIPIAEARERLREVMAAHANDTTFTLAARKESELTDADVMELLAAINELGLLKRD
ncbi:hypothetical protein [Bradyrhizobium sp. NP1]|uniref:hypothetical protein n=1 Tax=Bradyrhizobium sp. NP1 TaxID=3049772 RepID=UPI0025A5D937|nr:hypothetical protein [Bradyrhizobium sp. NP1]WJR74931.1 hypothetical protein QOU61_19070 [Bradyrhizobium sp. NP1]